MIDLTSSLYLGLRHDSAVVPPWTWLTTGVPAALAVAPEAGVVADGLAGLIGTEGRDPGAIDAARVLGPVRGDGRRGRSTWMPAPIPSRGGAPSVRSAAGRRSAPSATMIRPRCARAVSAGGGGHGPVVS